MFETLSVSKRITLAKQKMKKLLGDFLQLAALHENNAIVVFSPTLASQISPSYAAHAFNIFQHGMYDFEIVRLCALWDRAGTEKDSIPTVIELIDHPPTIDALADEARSAEHPPPVYISLDLEGQPSGLATDGYLGSREVEEAEVQRKFAELREGWASMVRVELTEAIASARSILKESRLEQLRTYRNEHLAHSLTIEKERAAPLKYGYPLKLFDASIPIVQKLHWVVTGNSFSINDSRKISRRSAEALWNRCRFEVEPDNAP